MNRPTSVHFQLLVLFLLAAPAFAAGPPSYDESFDTAVYRDPANTTADWNTSTGELAPFPFVPMVVGSLGLPGNTHGVALDGHLAYVADGTLGLRIVDIGNPASPMLIGTVSMLGVALDVAVSGNLVIVADDSFGLVMVDVTDPTAPAQLGVFATPGRARDVAIAGDLAYVADGTAGLLVVDISNPAAVATVGSIATSSFAQGIKVEGDLAYVADGYGGFSIVDISNPALPTIAGSYDSAGYAYESVVVGSHAFLADGTSVVVLDISNPASPTPIASVATPGIATGITVAGDLALVPDGSSGLAILDISDPASPVLTGSVAGAYGYSAAVWGEYAVLCNGAGVEIVAFAASTPPFGVGAIDLPGTLYRMVIQGSLALLATAGEGLQIVDISDPTSPVVVGVYDTPMVALGLAVAGNLAFVADGDAGLLAIDFSNPASPVLLGSYNSQGPVYNVDLAGNYAFVADGSGGLLVIDISDPTNLVPVSMTLLPNTAAAVEVSGDHAYVAGYEGHLYVIDISNPLSPLLIASYTTQGYANDLDVSGDIVAVPVRTHGLELIDVSDPANPTFLGLSDTPIDSWEVTISGHRAIVADGESGIVVIDISDPVAPVFVNGCATSGSAYAVTVDGGYFFAGTNTGSLEIVQLYQHEVAVVTGNVARSLVLDNGASPAQRARLTSRPANDVTWELGTAGAAWIPAPDGVWVEFATPGIDLRWQSNHDWFPGANLTATGLTVDWLYEHAIVTSITDIPNDQGRQVSLEWRRSGHDFLGDAAQITQYAVYRRIDPNLGKAQPGPAADLRGQPAEVLEHAEMMLGAGWHFLTTVPVRVEDDYAVVVPTLADSTLVAGQYFSTFMVSALTATPGVFYDSPPDSGYSMDDLAPGVPAAIMAAYRADSVALDWADAPEADFLYYRVYRSTLPGFIPGPENLVQETSSSAWTDPAANPWDYHYKITCLDQSGNESEAGSPEYASGAGEDAISARTALLDAAPNPFNPSTTLSFDLAQEGHATIRIYDAAGRHVITLVDETVSAGRHEVAWDGRDAAGRISSAGVYLYRLKAGGRVQTKRMTLIK